MYLCREHVLPAAAAAAAAAAAKAKLPPVHIPYVKSYDLYKTILYLINVCVCVCFCKFIPKSSTVHLSSRIIKLLSFTHL